MRSIIYKILGERYVKTKIVLIIFALFVLMNVAWVRTYYTCNLTGRFKIVDRVFFVPVRTVTQETRVSRWLDAQLGHTKYRIWCGGAFDNIIGGTTVAFKPQSSYVYQTCVLNAHASEEYKKEVLEELRKERQTPKSRSGFKFEIEENE